MPLYCFKCECGEIGSVHRPMSQSDRPYSCPVCDHPMSRDIRAEHVGFRHSAGKWPMESVAAGVSAEQVPEMVAFDRQNGVPTEYSQDGNPIFTSKTHRKKYLRAHGMYDRNAGYSDPEPVNR